MSDSTNFGSFVKMEGDSLDLDSADFPGASNADPVQSAGSSDAHKILDSIINHVFLPPKLPNVQDETKFEPHLTDILISSLQNFANLTDLSEDPGIKAAIDATAKFQMVRDENNHIHPISFKEALSDLVSKGDMPVSFELEHQVNSSLQMASSHSALKNRTPE